MRYSRRWTFIVGMILFVGSFLALSLVTPVQVRRPSTIRPEKTVVVTTYRGDTVASWMLVGGGALLWVSAVQALCTRRR
jgi:hypothetical protein